MRNNKILISLLLIFALNSPSLSGATSPFKPLVNWYSQSCRPFFWFIADFKSLSKDEQESGKDLLQMIETTLSTAIDNIRTDTISPGWLSGVPALIQGYLLTKTWSASQTEKLKIKIVKPLEAIATSRFACEYNLSDKLSFGILVEKAGIHKNDGLYLYYQFMLDTVQTALGWVGRPSTKPPLVIELPEVTVTVQ